MVRDTILSCRNLSFAYPGGSGVFSGLNVSIRAGEFVIVRGPSGSGKSTLLRLFTRMEEPTGGTISFNGRPIESYPPQELRRRVSCVQQVPTLLDGSVRDNLLLPFRFRANHSLPAPSDERLLTLLNEFLVEGVKLGDNAMTLSGGQRQRLCLIRSLLLSPEVLLLDEPLSNLDPESRMTAETIIEKVSRERNSTLVVVSHIGFTTKTAEASVLSLRNGGTVEVE